MNKQFRKKEYDKRYKALHKKETSEYNKAYYIEHRKDAIKNAKKYRQTHKKHIKKYLRKYYKKNKGSYETYRNTHKNLYREASVKYRNAHPEYAKKYRAIHPEYIRKYQKQRVKQDADYKMRCYLSSRIRTVLKGNIKSVTTAKLIGCSIKYLRAYLEKKFKKGMTWSNHKKDGWHIDHIKPCASFDLSKPSEQIKCFNYKNLQPLWADENRKKGTKYKGG